MIYLASILLVIVGVWARQRLRAHNTHRISLARAGEPDEQDGWKIAATFPTRLDRIVDYAMVSLAFFGAFGVIFLIPAEDHMFSKSWELYLGVPALFGLAGVALHQRSMKFRWNRKKLERRGLFTGQQAWLWKDLTDVKELSRLTYQFEFGSGARVRLNSSLRGHRQLVSDAREHLVNNQARAD